MLQKDPLNRISLAEIIGHPWLAEEVNNHFVVEYVSYFGLIDLNQVNKQEVIT